jgi:hypothetical protein
VFSSQLRRLKLVFLSQPYFVAHSHQHKLLVFSSQLRRLKLVFLSRPYFVAHSHKKDYMYRPAKYAGIDVATLPRTGSMAGFHNLTSILLTSLEL